MNSVEDNGTALFSLLSEEDRVQQFAEAGNQRRLPHAIPCESDLDHAGRLCVDASRVSFMMPRCRICTAAIERKMCMGRN